MNIFGKIPLLAVVFVALFSTSCDKGISIDEDLLPVTAHNISGNWKMVEINGKPLADSTFFYIKFVRNDKTFEQWTNFDSYSDVPSYKSGSFNIITNEYAVLRGNYDFGFGDWNSNYIVRLTPDSMKWTDEKDDSEIRQFVRVDSIPYDKKEE